MKKIIYSLSFFTITFLTIQCSDNVESKSNENLIDTSQLSTSLNLLETETYYVLAKSGLRMRDTPSLLGEKLGIVEYGDKVQVNSLDTSSTPVISNGISAPMVKVFHQNKEGYMFKGYLSSIPVPEKGQSPPEYARQLKKKGYAAKFDNVEEEMETEDILSIPTLDLTEAFLIGQRLDIFEVNFDLPASSNPKSITARINGKTTKVKRTASPSAAGMVDFLLPKTEKHIYHKMVSLKYKNDELKQIIYQTAYEGGSWKCSLEKEDEFYVFRKFAVAD